jgi:hypothetical protein
LASLSTLLVERSSYLIKRGHVLALPRRAFAQVIRKADAATSFDIFAELLTCGGSAQCRMGSAGEEA